MIKMKKNVLVISATLKSNYKLAEKIKNIVDKKKVTTTIISLEDFLLPIYTDKVFELEKNKYKKTIELLTNHFINNKGIIICGPEYNGSLHPIINNAIAWISTSTDYWRDAFKDKIVLVGTSSGGNGDKFARVMKVQLEHLGCLVMPRYISSNASNPLNIESTSKILDKFINLI